MRLKRLRLTNYRGFEALDVDLDRTLTVLVGVNGAGKSSVLHAIAAHQGWLLSVYDRRRSAAGLDLNRRDVRAGAPGAEIVTWDEHGGYDFAFRVWIGEGDPNWQGLFLEGSSSELVRAEGRPFLFLFGTDRRVGSAAVRDLGGDPQDVESQRVGEDEGLVAPSAGYARFVEWFKEREDVENERRVRARDFSVEDVQLRAVRGAIETLMPGFANLRIERDPAPAMVMTKGGREFRLDQLSDGERNLIALAGDLARRLMVAGRDDGSPREVAGVVLIDEVEQHLHPAAQREVLPRLMKAFPKVQFVVTTHSPQVLSSVPAGSVVLLKDFRAYRLDHPTEGRDSNAILREVFGVPERPEEEVEAIAAIRALIDDDRLDEARSKLAALALKLSERDQAVVALQTQLDFAEVGL